MLSGHRFRYIDLKRCTNAIPAIKPMIALDCAVGVHQSGD
jgi:hypothetical protein